VNDKPVMVTEDDGVLIVTLNRPEKLNAVNLPMSQALDEATWRFGDREDLRVMIITGTGRYFCAGLDISDAGQDERRAFEGDPETAIGARRKYRQRHHVLHDEFENIEKPIILAAQGPCLGLGLEMAASCDFRFCTPIAHFGLPEVARLGVIAGSGPRAVLEAAGVKDVLTKAYGSTNAVNLVKATFDGLMHVRTRAAVAKLRGVEIR
jgi:enoyl-CoA hydratase/carnithine racemase